MMTCRVCRHTSLDEIDRALISGDSFRNIAKRFRTSTASLYRHQKHLSETLQKAHQSAEAARADLLVGQLEALRKDAARIQAKAERAEDYRGALAGVRELERLLELSLRLSGQLVEGQTNIQTNVYAGGKPTAADQAAGGRILVRVMDALWGLDRNAIWVVTQEQLDQLTRELRRIYGFPVSPKDALEMGNAGLRERWLERNPSEP